MERSNVAEGLVQMGAYKEARIKAEETLEVAQRLGLFAEAWLRCNLGVAMSRLGELDDARAMATTAVEVCQRQGNRRTEGWARVYRSRILLRIGALDEAESEARAAIETGAAMPPVRANASAALATILGRRGRWADAVEAAEAAMKLLDAMEGTGEGEAYVRLTYGSVLASAGRRQESEDAMNFAQQRLISRAASISDPRWRMSFLENVPEHAATLEADPADPPASSDASAPG
jgi:tetratricopeptide (TPR) repeat protein